MKREEIVSKLSDLYQTITDSNIKIEDLSEDSLVMTGLGLNSVGLLYLAIAIEQTFDIDMSNVTIKTFNTIKDVIDYIEERI